MAKTAFVGTRIDPALKRDVERICDELGLSLSQAITLFLKQLQLQEGLPFEVRLPSKATRDAIASAAERRDLTSYDDPDALYDDLDL
jgi:DNA-damage-inducible protein J